MKLTQRHQHGPYTDYDAVIAIAPGLVIEMELTIVDEPGSLPYLSFYAGNDEERGESIGDVTITQAQADALLATHKEKA